MCVYINSSWAVQYIKWIRHVHVYRCTSWVKVDDINILYYREFNTKFVSCYSIPAAVV